MPQQRVELSQRVETYREKELGRRGRGLAERRGSSENGSSGNRRGPAPRRGLQGEWTWWDKDFQSERRNLVKISSLVERRGSRDNAFT